MTHTELLDVLRDIARYVLPTYTFEGKPFVPIGNADALRTMAKEALAEDASSPNKAA